MIRIGTVTDTMEAKAEDSAERRERLSRLLDDLTEDELQTVETFVEFVHEHGGPLLRKLMSAPLDDEPVSDEEEEAVREAWEAVEEGDVYTLEEVRKELEG